jgi:hypothetical protein
MTQEYQASYSQSSLYELDGVGQLSSAFGVRVGLRLGGRAKGTIALTCERGGHAVEMTCTITTVARYFVIWRMALVKTCSTYPGAAFLGT